jgi:hypothetical protein
LEAQLEHLMTQLVSMRHDPTNDRNGNASDYRPIDIHIELLCMRSDVAETEDGGYERIRTVIAFRII